MYGDYHRVEPQRNLDFASSQIPLHHLLLRLKAMHWEEEEEEEKEERVFDQNEGGKREREAKKV